MARQDIAGLLTGMPSNRPDPMAMGGNSAQQRLAFGAQRAQGMQRGLRGAMGQDPRTTSEKLQEAMSRLDLRKPEDLRKLAGLQQATGDLAGAAKTAAALQQTEQDQAVRATLIKRAKTLDMPDIEEFLVNGGDIGAATTILFRQPKDIGKPSDVGLTENEMLLYDAILGNVDPEESDKKFWTGLNQEDKRIVFQRAEEAVAAARDAGRTLTREQALREVLKRPLPKVITDDEYSSNTTIIK